MASAHDEFLDTRVAVLPGLVLVLELVLIDWLSRFRVPALLDVLEWLDVFPGRVHLLDCPRFHPLLDAPLSPLDAPSDIPLD